MKFSSFVSIAGLAATAFAGAVLPSKRYDAPAAPAVPATPAAPPAAPPAPPAAPPAIHDGSSLISACHGLLINIQIHTGKINETVSGYHEGVDKSLIGVSIKAELGIIVTLIKVVVTALQAVVGLLVCTKEEILTIVGLLVAIVLEIVFTVLHVIKVLGIKALLAVILGELSKILCTLIVLVDHLVGGVLVLVLGLLAPVLALVDSVLIGLIGFLSIGKILL